MNLVSLRTHVVLTTLTLFSSIFLSGCGQLQALRPQKHTIDAVITVKPQNPLLKELAAMTQKVEIQAAGELHQGNYQINGKTITVTPGTEFKLELTLPIKDPDVITTADALGKLYTSKPLLANGLGMPQELVLERGKVSGEVDLIRTFGAFFLNTIQMPGETGGVRQMIQYMYVPRARMELRPGSVFSKQNKTIHIGPNSSIELTDLALDKSLNYRGNCQVDLRFLPDCHWIGERVNCHFNGGSAFAKLRVNRHDDVLTFFSPSNNEPNSEDEDKAKLDSSKNMLKLEACNFEFGKLKRSHAKCTEADISLKTISWQKAGSQNADLHIDAPLQLNDTELLAKTDTQETLAFFPNKNPCEIQIDIDKEGRATSFATLKPARAKSARITINKPSSHVVLNLADATVGPISFDKSGDLDLQLSAGIARVLGVEWSNGKKHFEMQTPGSSELAIPEGMTLSLGKDHPTEMSLPMHIRLGQATMQGSAGAVKLANVNGTVNLNINREVTLHSDVDFVLQQSELLGVRKAQIQVRGLDLHSKGQTAECHLDKCLVDLPEADLQSAIQNQFPKEKVVEVDKTFLQKRKWRYRNAKVQTVTVRDLKLEKMSSNGANAAQFTVSADVLVSGTIEKTSVMAVFKESNNYKTKPWSVSAHVTGNGSLKFNFVPSDSLAKSKVTYDLAMDLILPDDIDLDWAKVENGIFSKIERSVILSNMKDANPIPIKYSSEMRCFADPGAQLKSICIKGVSTKPSNDGTQLSFKAEANF